MLVLASFENCRTVGWRNPTQHHAVYGSASELPLQPTRRVSGERHKVVFAILKEAAKRLPVMVERRRLRSRRKSLGIPLLKELELAEHKKSDTVFIFGRRPRSEQMSAERRAAVARHDSIGFNFWLGLQTLYAYEQADGNASPEVYPTFARLAREGADQYRQVPQIATELRPTYQVPVRSVGKVAAIFPAFAPANQAARASSRVS
jgi:hypothetical protein